MLGAVEMCNNNGTCRAFDASVMCPSWRVTRDEQHLTRGRANTLRLALTGQLGADAMASDALAKTMALCVSCKACRRECPTGVDMAKLKIEVLAARAERHGVGVRETLIAELPRYAPFAARLAPLVNLRNAVPLLRRMGERWLGLAAARPLPAWRRDFFRDAEAAALAPAKPRGEVLLLADTFNRYFEPENLRAALRVLAAAGYRARLPVTRGRPLCCGRTFLAAGLVDQARAEAGRTLRRAGGHAAGDRAGAVLPVHPARRVPLVASRAPRRTRWPGARCCWRNSWRARRSTLPLRPLAGTAHVHGHCHQKSFGAFPDAIAALQAGAGPDGEADRLVMLRHGRQLRLPGGDAGRLARDGRGVAAAGGARGRGRRTSSWRTAPRAGTKFAIWPGARRCIRCACWTVRWDDGGHDHGHDPARGRAGIPVRARSICDAWDVAGARSNSRFGQTTLPPRHGHPPGA